MRIIKNIIYKMMLCLVAVLMAFSAQASEITMTTYYPSINGEYSQFRLVPRTADLTGSCTAGSLYVNSSNSLQYCSDVAGVGTWGPIPGIWTQIGDNIYLTDYDVTTPSNVGVGTITPVYLLTLLDDSGIIAKGTFGSGATIPDSLSASGNSRLIWYPRKAAFRAGYSSGNSWDDANIGDYSAAMGANTVASGAYSVAAGGDSNTASGQYSNVIGGQTNIASGNYSAVTGGRSNNASDDYTTITGGQGNIAGTAYSTIIGGQDNSITAHIVAGTHSTVGGGIHNRIYNAGYSNINGGKDNYIAPNLEDGLTTADYSVIGGGLANNISNTHSVVSGGANNRADRNYSSVGGGSNNVAGIADGMVDIYLQPIPTSGDYSRISGGSGNITTGDYSTVSGGMTNSATGDYSTIGGGSSNTASGAYSVVSGGQNNVASGNYSTIIGGSDNIASGDYSWVGGRGIRLYGAQTFVWGYAENPISVSSVVRDAFIIAPGNISNNPWNPKVGIRDLSPSGVLEINANSTTDHFVYIKQIAPSPKDIFVIKNSGYIGVQKPDPTVATHAMQFGTANDAYLSTGGAWTNGSSRDAKKD
ncbi:MAG: hypothetical protein IT395_04970, partial [Candidatus Omnitrophica bacterium]|nr:hypothetical protein [Candidatus Omnitrophota bacterium]